MTQQADERRESAELQQPRAAETEFRIDRREFHGIRAATAVDALAIAAANSKLREMKLLIADGVDVSGRCSRDETPLHTAAGLGLTRSVDLLIKAGADLNLLDDVQLTPLMSACSLGKLKGSRVAMQLIAAGADVRYVRVADEMTALKFAARECLPEVVEALIEREAEVDGPEGTDQTALMLAARYGNVAALKVLVAHGADWKRPCGLPWAAGKTAEWLAQLEKRRKAVTYLRSLRLGEVPA